MTPSIESFTKKQVLGLPTFCGSCGTYISNDERVFLICGSCRDVWSMRVPVTEVQLRESVKANSRCLNCSSKKVLLARTYEGDA